MRREPSSCMHGGRSAASLTGRATTSAAPTGVSRERGPAEDFIQSMAGRGRPWHAVCAPDPSGGRGRLAASRSGVQRQPRASTTRHSGRRQSGCLAIVHLFAAPYIPNTVRRGCALACASIGQPCVHASGCAVDARTQRRLASASIQSLQPTVRWSPGPDCYESRTVSGLGALETSTEWNGRRLLIAASPAPGWTAAALPPPPALHRAATDWRHGLGLKFSSPHLRSQVQPASSSLWTRAASSLYTQYGTHQMAVPHAAGDLTFLTALPAWNIRTCALAVTLVLAYLP